MNVSIEFARLFKDQCVGGHSGHMATIDNNPLFCSMFRAMAGTYDLDDLTFADTLEAIANALRNQKQF